MDSHQLCDRLRHRLFARTAPADVDRWRVLLWLTGRAELPGRGRVGHDWRWDSTVAAT